MDLADKILTGICLTAGITSDYIAIKDFVEYQSFLTETGYLAILGTGLILLSRLHYIASKKNDLENRVS